MFKNKFILFITLLCFSVSGHTNITTDIKNKIDSTIQSKVQKAQSSQIDQMLQGKNKALIPYDSKNIRIAKGAKLVGRVRGAKKIISGKGLVSTGAQVLASEVAVGLYLDSKLNTKRYEDFKNDPDFLDIVEHLTKQFDIIDQEFQTDPKWKKFHDICLDPVKSKEMINYILTMTPNEFDNKMTELGVVSTKSVTGNNFNSAINTPQFYTDSYSKNLKNNKIKPTIEHIDHIPAYKSIEQTLISSNFNISNIRKQNINLSRNTTTIVTPIKIHKLGRTYSKAKIEDIGKLRTATILDLSSILYLMRYNYDLHNLYSKKELKQMFVDYQKSGIILYIRNKQLCLN